MLKSTVLAAIICAASANMADAWGAEGHTAVGILIQRLVNPNTATAIAQLLKEDKVDSNPQGDFGLAATWADRIKGLGAKYAWSKPLHYVDIQGPGDAGAQNAGSNLEKRDVDSLLADSSDADSSDMETLSRKKKPPKQGPPTGEPSTGEPPKQGPPTGEPPKQGGTCGVYKESDCPNGVCLISGIANYTQRVCNGQGPGRAEAARFLLHFLGDIAQPLHNSGVAKGGNGDKCTFGKKHTNLHAVWDESIIHQNIAGNFNGYVDTLEKDIRSGKYASEAATWKKCFDGTGDLKQCTIDWSNEGNQFNCDSIFPAYNAAVAKAAEPDLSTDYYQANAENVNKFISRAAVRGAAYLDKALGSCGGTGAGAGSGSSPVPPQGPAKTPVDTPAIPSAPPKNKGGITIDPPVPSGDSPKASDEAPAVAPAA